MAGMAGFRSFQVAGLLLSLSFLSCRQPKVVLAGEGPVAQFARQDHWLYVYATQIASRSELLRMTAFSRFTPGHSVDSAIRSYGQPARHLSPEEGSEYVEYEEAGGIYRLGSEESADGATGYPLYFFPSTRRPEDFFPPVVLRRLNLRVSHETVMFFECGYEQPFILSTLENGMVTKFVWLPTKELGRRASSTQCTD